MSTAPTNNQAAGPSIVEAFTVGRAADGSLTIKKRFGDQSGIGVCVEPSQLQISLDLIADVVLSARAEGPTAPQGVRDGH